MVNPIIERALKETVWRYGQTISPGFHPNRYSHPKVTLGGGPVKEHDLVFHFVNALERHCALPVSYREFSCDGDPDGKAVQYVDAVVVDMDSIYLIEAKGSLVIEKNRQLNKPGRDKLTALESQVKDLEDASYNLRCYLVRRIVNRFGTPEFGRRSIRHLWGVALADTFQVGTSTWMNLNEAQYPVLASYTRAVHECEQYRTGDDPEWFILSGYKRLSDPDGGISCKRDGALPLSCPVEVDNPYAR